VGQVESPKRSTCNCAERTGELIVFTCPLCMSAALVHLKGLTKRGKLIKVDSKGSVSGLELELEPSWLEIE